MCYTNQDTPVAIFLTTYDKNDLEDIKVKVNYL